MRCTHPVLHLLALIVSAAAPARAAIMTTGDVDPTHPGTDPWTISAELWVGNSSVGDLTASAGSSVSNTFGRIGRQAGAVGTVTVTGSGSTWTNSQALSVGDSGEGTLSIEEGGSIASASGRLGNNAASTGTATIDGSESEWSNGGGLAVGFAGSGEMTIANGGNVTNADGTIGFDSNSVGTATVTGSGSTWSNGLSLVVGLLGTGTLSITDGGSVENTAGTLGFNEDATGSATISGESSAWTNSNDLVVGNSGTGELTIKSGGTVSSVRGFVGRFAGSAGNVEVTGAGSNWTMSDELTVAVLVDEFASGKLMIADGGNVTNTSAVIGGSSSPLQPSPEARVTVTGVGSSWNMTGGLTMNESGTLTVESAGTVNTTDDLSMSGQLTISAGGSVFSDNGALLPSSSATVTGSGSAWTIDKGLSIAGSALPVFPSSAILGIQGGGAVSVREEITLFENGILGLDGGTLTASTVSFQGGEFTFLSGTLHVEQFDGGLLNQGGTLAPGRSAGSTTISVGYQQEVNATLQIEIGGTTAATQHDFVEISGSALLDGTLELALLDGFVPGPADEFVVFDSNSLSGTFTNIANGQRLETADGLGSFLVHYGPMTVFDPNQIVLTDFLSSLTADFDNDGDVDGQDFLVWQRGESPNPSSISDLELWQRQYGDGSLTATAFVAPEPICVWLVIFSLVVSLATSRLGFLELTKNGQVTRL